MLQKRTLASVSCIGMVVNRRIHAELPQESRQQEHKCDDWFKRDISHQCHTMAPGPQLQLRGSKEAELTFHPSEPSFWKQNISSKKMLFKACDFHFLNLLQRSVASREHSLWKWPNVIESRICSHFNFSIVARSCADATLCNSVDFPLSPVSSLKFS